MTRMTRVFADFIFLRKKWNTDYADDTGFRGFYFSSKNSVQINFKNIKEKGWVDKLDHNPFYPLIMRIMVQTIQVVVCFNFFNSASRFRIAYLVPSRKAENAFGILSRLIESREYSSIFVISFLSSFNSKMAMLDFIL